VTHSFPFFVKSLIFLFALAFIMMVIKK